MATAGAHAPDAAVMTDAQGGAGGGTGTCCSDGDCICRGEMPTMLTSEQGPYATETLVVADIGYP